MIYRHWREVRWDSERWPNITPRELACRHCGQYFHDPQFLDQLQAARSHAGIPFIFNSGHRCPIHNARVGGAPLSAHKRIAADIAVTDQTKALILRSLIAVGLTTFGFYGTFIHTDPRPRRRWITKAGRRTWNGLVNF